MNTTVHPAEAVNPQAAVSELKSAGASKRREGDIFRMERLARDEAYDSFAFLAMFPNGPRVCKFLDAYFGFMRIEGVTPEDKFVTTHQIDEAFPDLQCIAITGAA